MSWSDNTTAVADHANNPLAMAGFFYSSMFPGSQVDDNIPELLLLRRAGNLSATNSSSAKPGAPPPGEWNGWPWDFSGFPHDNFGPQINYGVWVMTAIASGFLALRIYCKFLRHRGLWWDDHFLVFSWICLVVQSSLVSYNVNIGYGQHIWDFRPQDLQAFLLVSNTSGFFSILAAQFSKTSFAITVLRISEGWTRRFIWLIIWSVNMTLGFAAVSTYVQCSPTEKLWRPFLRGTCWPKDFIIQYNIFTAWYSGALDIVLALLPWRIIWNLTINKKEKLGVMVAMSMGIFAGAISFLKITQLPAINKADPVDGIWLTVLGTAEPAITIMAASIPVLRALVRDNAPRRAPVRFMYNGDGPGMLYTGGRAGGHSNTTITSRSARRASISSTRSWAQKLHAARRRPDDAPPAPTLGAGAAAAAATADDDDWFRRMEAGLAAPPPGKIEVGAEFSVEYEDADGKRLSPGLPSARPATKEDEDDYDRQRPRDASPVLDQPPAQAWGPLSQDSANNNTVGRAM